MQEAEDLRKVPLSWKDYLRDILEVLRVIRWVYKELMPKDSLKWTKRFLIGLVAMTAFQMLQPWMVSHIFNGIIIHDAELFWFGFGGFTVCVAFQKLANWYESYAREWILGLNAGSVDHRITELLFEKSMGQHMQESSQLHNSNIDKGRWKAIELMSMLLYEGVPVLLVLTISYVFLWILSPVAGVVMTLVVTIHTTWSLFLNQQVVQVCTPIDADFRRLNRHRLERWEKMERVQTCGKQDEELFDMTGWWDRAIAKDRQFWLWYIGQSSMRGVINLIGLVLIMGYGAWLVWSEVWQAGMLYPLFTWATMLSFNLWQISRIEHQLNWNLPSVRSMMEALMIEPDVKCHEDAVVISDRSPVHIAFENVCYSYASGSGDTDLQSEEASTPTISNVSFEIEPYQIVALIGASGNGKTTLMRLLLRYMDVDTGCIRINGHELTDINLASWMRCIGYIPQQAQVLDGTIRYNLTYGLSVEEKEKVTDEELWEMMRLLEIDFGERLTYGLDTLVGRNGMKLSGGQAQRLMIGAAVMKKPSFMIIDEATSSLDSTTEKSVQAGLTKVLAGNVGALIIAHRLSTVRDLCHRFIVLQPSSAVSEGGSQVEAVAASFEELYQISPTFRRLADDQGVSIDDNPLIPIGLHNARLAQAHHKRAKAVKQ